MLLKNINIDFPESLFWDTDKNKIDMEKHASFIVDRVVSMGSWECFKSTLAYYGRDKFIEIVINIRYLDDKTLSFCSAYFNKAFNEFRCYNYRQSNQVHWNY